jgi:hypothetical protein
VRGVVCGALPLLLVLSGGAAHAQGPSGLRVPCDGRAVSAIEVTSEDPTFLKVPRGLGWFARGVGLLHTTSKSEVISSFLLLEVGETCTEIARAESERILRTLPFLADATVRTVPDSTGGVRVEVETIDDIAVVFRMRTEGLAPSAVRFGNGNVGGQGLSLDVWLERGFSYRTGVGISGVAYQVLSRPYRMELLAERAPLGSALSVAFGHPFLTDLQRTAWHIGWSKEDRYSSFLAPDGPELTLGVRRGFWDLGMVRRVGSRRSKAFVGMLLTRESVRPREHVVIVSDSGLVVDESGALGGPLPAYRNLRVNAVVGVRALSFVPVRGFDALDAVQDVATGVQLGTLVGRGIPRFGTDGGDLFVSADLYAGLGAARSFAAIRVEGEARREFRTNRWGSVVVGGRLAWYLKPSPKQVFIAGVEMGGAWRQRVPLQLALGDRQGGVRGYSDSRAAGAWRSVARLEGRWSIASFGRRGTLGLAAFADAGRVWAGDVPLGEDSGTRVGVGLGLLAAVPPRSRRLWRVDIVVPVSADRNASWEVRLSSAWTRGFWREPDDVRRARAGAAPATIFTW